jgi:hypothetical protein
VLRALLPGCRAVATYLSSCEDIRASIEYIRFACRIPAVECYLPITYRELQGDAAEQCVERVRQNSTTMVNKDDTISRTTRGTICPQVLNNTKRTLTHMAGSSPRKSQSQQVAQLNLHAQISAVINTKSP